MSTPCILAYGSRSQWTGVPCRMEGAPESTGPVLLDAVLRNGVDGSAKKLVLDAPLGWAWAGGPALGEVDEYLAGEGLSSSTPQEILDRHYALYLLDRERGCLDITVLGDEPPLQPIFAEAGGSLASLPPWYPQPNLAAKAEPHALSPEAKSRAQTFCDENRIRWPILRGALRAWCLESLGDLRGVSWLLAGGHDAEAYAGGRVADSVLHIAPDQGTARFTCSDGRLRSIDIHDVGRAGKILEALARSPRHAGDLGRAGMPLPRHAGGAIQALLSAAYAEACGSPLGHVSWSQGTSTWMFFSPSTRYPSSTEVEEYPVGWLAPFLAFVLF